MKPILNKHQVIDMRLVALHRIVRERLLSCPAEVRQIAAANLKRWAARGIDCDADREWRAILNDFSDELLADFLISPSETATRLRQSTPFPGVVTESERRQVFLMYADFGSNKN